MRKHHTYRNRRKKHAGQRVISILICAVVVLMTAFSVYEKSPDSIRVKISVFFSDLAPGFTDEISRFFQTLSGEKSSAKTSASSEADSSFAEGLAASGSPSPEVSVHFLDVGQGTATLITSDDEAMLIDGGGRKYSSFVVSYLTSLGISRLRYLAASHYDEDHIAGLVGALYNFEVETVLEPDYEADTAIYASYKKAEEASGAVSLTPAFGDTFSLGSCTLTVKGPVYYGHEEENNDSLSFSLSCGSRTFLFMGDTQQEGEREILDRCQSKEELQSDVLDVGHHGSSGSSSPAFLNAVSPSWAIISVGAGNHYGLPTDAVLSRLQDTGAAIYRTDKCGTIICRSDGTALVWSFVS